MREKPKILEGESLEEVVFGFNVAGITFCNVDGLLKNIRIRNMYDDVSFIFVPEPDNIYDSNAVRVEIKLKSLNKEKKIGYIPKDSNHVASWVLCEGKNEYKIRVLEWSILGGTAGKDNCGVNINYKIERV